MICRSCRTLLQIPR
ncbi:MAG: hypothetical protein ACFFDP_04665 [Promethearchaeota archaeon]